MNISPDPVRVVILLIIVTVAACVAGIAIGTASSKGVQSLPPTVSPQPVSVPTSDMDHIINRVAELCYKGVTYVVFNPGYYSSIASVELDRQGHVVICN